MKAIAVLLAIGLCFTAATALADVVNVRDFGAKGDGKADDSDAILAAIAKAGFAGTVNFPPGSYKLTKPLVLKGNHLEGRSAGGWPADADVMPRLLVRHDSGPAIRCESYSSTHGLCMNYQNGGENPKPYPPAIELAGNGISISNVKIWGAYDAIAADGKSNVGRVNLENIFLPEVFHTGVYLTKAYDIPTVRNVEVFCTNRYFLDHGIGFHFGRLDELHATNNFVIGAKTGILFDEDKSENGGGTYGGLFNCSTDACQTGVEVRAGMVRVTNGSYLSHHYGFIVSNPKASLLINGAVIQANSRQGLQVSDCGSVNITGCRFQRAFQNKDNPMVLLEGGKNIALNGNVFDAFGPGVRVDRAKSFAITGNVFEESPFAKIEDKSPKGTRKVVQSNLE